MTKYVIMILLICTSITALYSSRVYDWDRVDVTINIRETHSVQFQRSFMTFNLVQPSHTPGMLYAPVIETNVFHLTSIGAANRNRRLFARLNQPFDPPTIRLYVQADAIPNAFSRPWVQLGAQPRIVIDNMTSVHARDRLMQFRVIADVGATVGTLQRQVIFEIMD